MSERIRYLWTRATTPVKVGLFFGALGGLLALLGWVREGGDLLGLVIALLISFATWGVVSWAIAQAVHEVEKDEGV
ncbi:MAG: hypothetical protein WBH57_02150 [Anaerolineae bacterium]